MGPQTPFRKCRLADNTPAIRVLSSIGEVRFGWAVIRPEPRNLPARTLDSSPADLSLVESLSHKSLENR